MKRVRVAALFGVGVVLALSGCSSSGPVGGGPTSHLPASPTASGDPALPVGFWERLTSEIWQVDADGEPETSALTFGGELTLIRACGAISVGWQGTPHGTLAITTSSWQPCPGHRTGIPVVDWLDRTVAVRPARDGVYLLDSGGAVTAHLVPGAILHNREEIERRRIVGDSPIWPQTLARLSQALPPLPAGTRPAAMADVVGRWGPPLDVHLSPAARPRSFLAIDAAGVVRGSDGCNGISGRIRVDDDGAVAAAFGPQTLVGCEGYDAPFYQTARLGIDANGQLVLMAPVGTQTGWIDGDESKPDYAEGPFVAARLTPIV